MTDLRAPAMLPGGHHMCADRSQEASPWADFVADNYLDLVRLGWLLTGDANTAEDLVHDVALALMQGPTRHVDHPAAYFRRALVNRRQHVFRRDSKRRQLAREQAATTYDAATDNVARIEVFEALNCLRPKERAAVVLRYYNDLNDIEIGDALGVRPSTVRSLLRRARSKLRPYFDNTTEAGA